jgi:hypothetical protein
MAQPVTIEAEFGAGVFTWGGTPSYVDLTDRTISFSVNRGRSDYTRPYNAGTCSLTLRNLDGVLDPDNAAGPYFGKIEPGRRIRITSNASSFIYAQRLFVGFITDIRLGYELGGQATVTITAADGLSLLAQQTIADGTTFLEESTYDRFENVVQLPEVDYPFLVGLSSGFSTCEAGTASGNVLQYLAQVATTEQGAIYVDRNGTLVFRNRYELLNPPTLTFTDDGGNVNYEVIRRLVTALELYNELAANRAGQPDVVRTSATSKGLFGIRFLDLGEVLFGSDGEVTDMLDFAMVRFASANPRIDEVTTLMDSKGAIVVAQLAQLELAESVTVEFTPPNVAPISVPCTIESISHQYTVGQGWRATFGFTPRDTSNYLVLDDPTLGRLDFNVLGF